MHSHEIRVALSTTTLLNQLQSSQCLLGRGLGSRLEGVSQAAFAARLSVLVPGHEDSSTTSSGGALRCQYVAANVENEKRTLSPEAGDLAVGFDLVVLENSHFDLLSLVLDLLGSSLGSQWMVVVRQNYN
jgi:hypothetical protein